MGRLKRITACLLASVTAFHLVAFPASAVSAFTTHSGDGSIVRIQVAPGARKETDFVLSFPKRLSLAEGSAKNPLEKVMEPLAVQYLDVPSYFQLSYDHILYGDGTVATSGSSITALAMAATYLSGYIYEPDVLARWFAGKKNNDIERVTYAAKALKLPYEVTQKWEEAYKELKNGKLLVIQTDAQSVFQGYSHFVVLKGVTADGKILVNDPSIENLLKEDLKDKYTTGFSEEEISSGFRYAWIFDKNKVPANLTAYTDTAASNGTKYNSLKLTPAEKQLLARVVAVNAAGECEEGQQMMIEVILNRMLSKEYPNELKEIVYGEEPLCDVESLNAVKLTQTHYLAVERALHGPYKLEKGVTDFTYQCHK